jgi:hypothetical protein
MNDQETAATRYEVHLDSIMNLLDEIRGDVAMHNVHFDRNGRRCWSSVGDLEHIERLLQEVSNFLNNKE